MRSSVAPVSSVSIDETNNNKKTASNVVAGMHICADTHCNTYTVQFCDTPNNLEIHGYTIYSSNSQSECHPPEVLSEQWRGACTTTTFVFK